MASVDPTLSVSPAAAPMSSGLTKEHVAAFFTKAMMRQENRMDWTLEEAVIEKLLILLKEIPTPSQEELQAFFTLLLSLKKETLEKESFKTHLLVLSRKEKIDPPLAAFLIVATCRHLFSMPLGEICSTGFTVNQEKWKELAEILVACFSYLDLLLQPLVKELHQEKSDKGIKKAQQKLMLPPQKHAPSLEKIKKKIQKSAPVLENFLIPSQEKVQRLFTCIQGLEMRTRKGGTPAFFTADLFSKSEVPLRQLSSYHHVLTRHLNDLIDWLELNQIEVSNCQLINKARMPKTTGTRIIDSDGYVKAIRELFQRRDDKEMPEDEFNQELDKVRGSLAREEIPPDKNGSAYFFAQQEQLFAARRYADLKEKATLLRDIHSQTIAFLLEKLEGCRKNFPLQEETSWLFLDEEEEEATLEPKVAKVRSLPPIPTLDDTLKVKIPSSPNEIIFHQSFILSREVKKNLLEQLESKALPAGTYEKALRAIREMGDHMYYSALNLRLFTEMLMEGDLFGLNVIVPLIFLDLHIQLEQRMKFPIILSTGKYPKTHNLRELAMPDERVFHHGYLGLIHARYPIASKDHYRNSPKELEWILFSLSLPKEEILSKNSVEQLKRLIIFVFTAYEETLTSLSGKEDLKEPLEACKKELMQKMDSLLEKPLQACKKGKVPPTIAREISVNLKTQKCKEPIHKALLEAGAHLDQISSASYLKMNYTDPLFSPLHERNHLLYQWVFEQLFVAQGLALGIGDLRWIRHHDLAGYYYMVHPDQFEPHDARLDPFNFGRTLHYGREKPVDELLPPIRNLREQLKRSKTAVNQKLLKLLSIKKEASRPAIFIDYQKLAEDLLKSLVEETLTTISASEIDSE